MPLVTIGTLAAVLVWDLERIRSGPLSLVLLVGTAFVGLLVARRVQRHIERLSTYYLSLIERTDEASRRAETASRLKDDFLATLSHELRTPLNSVLGWARLVGSGKLDPEQTRRAITAIERAGWTQSRLIEDLLDAARAVNGTLQLSPTPTALPPLVGKVVEGMKPAADAKGLSLEVRIDPDLDVVVIDPDRFRQILWNLMSNATKFTPCGGRIELAIGSDHGALQIVVTDTGIGFDQDVAAMLFERFRQADSSVSRPYGGLGLGLGIVRHLTELHGGTVTGESHGPNLGATFRVRLPLVRALGPLPASSPLPGPMLHALTVLVVDDDPHVLELVREALTPRGATVVTAGSADEAREIFSRAQPDVVVCDLMMPGGDGYDLIRDIRAMPRPASRVPAAALTGLARTEDRRSALEAGYDMHITKPIDPDELASAVEHLAASPHDAISASS